MTKVLTACVFALGFLSCSYFVDPVDHGLDAQNLRDDGGLSDGGLSDGGLSDVNAPDVNAPGANAPDANLPDAIIPYVPTLRINEFSADSNVTQTGIDTDWVELKNISDADVNLEGYFLTDSLNNLTKYAFPPIILEPGAYLVVQLTSDEIQSANLVVPFSLSSEGEYLALVDPNRTTIVSEFRPYPQQRYAHSFGIDETETDSIYGYFTTPTPGQRNEQTLYKAITQRVQHSQKRGFYEQALEFALESEEGSQIYYTLDGSSPSAEGALRYVAPLSVTSTTVVRSIAIKDGFLPSDKNAHSYIFTNDVLNQPALPEGFPAQWQPGAQAHYAVDATLAEPAELLASLRSYPTLSLTMPIDDWFNPSTDPAIGGIYSNSVDARGFDWERVVSAEFFDFEHGQEVIFTARWKRRLVVSPFECSARKGALCS